ncbi:unnamed protein product [Phytophthora lilii]|uniref:Unnamed protein product n=1 Tax=Phytophthora lilii TaxID=2077276 RepID=A0A9W6TNX1_9STRA|nr:unnamed protein product [Phytophthora lilii]
MAELPSTDAASNWSRYLAVEQIDRTADQSLRSVDEEGNEKAAAEEKGSEAAVLDKMSTGATKLKLPKAAMNLQG